MFNIEDALFNLIDVQCDFKNIELALLKSDQFVLKVLHMEALLHVLKLH